MTDTRPPVHLIGAAHEAGMTEMVRAMQFGRVCPVVYHAQLDEPKIDLHRYDMAVVIARNKNIDKLLSAYREKDFKMPVMDPPMVSALDIPDSFAVWWAKNPT